MRLPKPFYRKQTNSYYVKLNGRWVNLGSDETKAWEKYHTIMAGRQEPEPDVKVPVLLDNFLDWTKQNRAEATYDWYLAYLQPFKDYIGNVRVSDVKPHHVTSWLSEYTTDGNRNCGVRAVKRAFKWAEDEGYIPRSPVARVKRPTLPGRDVYLEPKQWQQFIGLIPPGSFHDAVSFLRLTGCRPDELFKIEARHIEGHCVVLDRLKSKGKRSKRVIPLTKSAMAIVKPLMEKHPNGPIFRTNTAKPWTSDSLNTRFDHFEKKLNAGVDKENWVRVFPYIIRHSFITDALANGMDPIKLATIVGHTDLKMIMQVYQHLEKKRDSLREALERITEDVSSPQTAA